MIYKNLSITEIKDPAARSRPGCLPYRFLIRSNGTAHSAYYTEGGLNRFLKDSGLTVRWLGYENETIRNGVLIGEYQDICLMRSREYFEALFGGAKSRFYKSFRLSNGDYTAFYCNGKGVMVHLNPNIRDREVIPHGMYRGE